MEVVMFTYFIFGKMSFNRKVGMITGSNIAIAPSFQVCYRNWMLQAASKSYGKQYGTH